MIELTTALNLTKELFPSYEALFEHIVETENMKMIEKEPDWNAIQWSFITYPPQHVETLYTHLKGQHSAIKEATESQLPLIEITTGNCASSEYHVGTATLEVEELKKKWTLAYCAAHNLTVWSSSL